jgi:hypothetical protein
MSKIKTLTKVIAEQYLKNRFSVFLSQFNSIELNAAQVLGQIQGDSLDLSGLVSLGDEAAQALAQHKGVLRLDGLESLSDGAAQVLAQHEGGLDLRGLTSLSDSPGHVALAKKLGRK